MLKKFASRCHGGAAMPALLLPCAAMAQDKQVADAGVETVLGQVIYVAPSAAPVDVIQPTSIRP